MEIESKLRLYISWIMHGVCEYEAGSVDVTETDRPATRTEGISAACSKTRSSSVAEKQRMLRVIEYFAKSHSRSLKVIRNDSLE